VAERKPCCELLTELLANTMQNSVDLSVPAGQTGKVALQMAMINRWPPAFEALNAVEGLLARDAAGTLSEVTEQELATLAQAARDAVITAALMPANLAQEHHNTLEVTLDLAVRIGTLRAALLAAGALDPGQRETQLHALSKTRARPLAAYIRGLTTCPG
jgi:hypothetical protein